MVIDDNWYLLFISTVLRFPCFVRSNAKVKNKFASLLFAGQKKQIFNVCHF
jgi:hypothetical protein